ncbi:MAG: hypothetical protein M5U28_53240 [Sandaracinaceae bacterium]|nr:hypothetical protein [Sandaracinaceae bacterium]
MTAARHGETLGPPRPVPTIDPADGYTLEGRIVTMGPLGVIDDGAVCVRGDRIVTDHARRRAAASGARRAAHAHGRHDLPGLIELHNHLSYNVLPLWDMPQRFTNHETWKRHRTIERR